MSSLWIRRDAENVVNHVSLGNALKWVMPANSFGACRFGVNTLWKARMLAFSAILWVWSDESTLGKRFIAARKRVIKMFAWQEQPGTSYQGFTKALHKRKEELFAVILPRLRHLMQQCAGDFWTVAGWVVFGVDGSRVQTPRTKANEARFHPTKKRKKQASRPQGPHWAVDQKGESKIQTGKATKTRRQEAGEQKLEEAAGRVYLWPDAASKKMQPPMVLRLITVHNGRHPIYLVTNVLGKEDLSDRNLIEIYRARWGIEVFFRSFKQTFGRRKLRSDSPDNALLELDWSLVGLWMVYLMAVAEVIEQGESPHRVSVAGVLSAIRTVMRDYRWRPDPGEDLTSLLGQALIDSYVRHRSKTSRNYPRKKNEKPAGKPVIQPASRDQIAQAKERKAHQQEKRLTA